ncbi:SRPBCC family protein [Pengzhenrongella sicca]|uniref:SRPBCC family protein n=1 Tax=Pengzhenrongella sicca TaxID=2819238 RepID=A0A8A4ZP00_9MICO|nr:SRPBCC family protein [Pengzhenrongella sicca]
MTVTRDLDCAPDAVLEVLADGWTYATWVVGASRLRGVDRSWPAPGSRIAHSVGCWPAVLDDVTTVRRWDPSAGIELQARAWPAGEARVRIDVAARAGGGARVRISEDAVRGPGTLVPRPLRAALLAPRNTETLRRLAMLAERRPTPGGDRS